MLSKGPLEEGRASTLPLIIISAAEEALGARWWARLIRALRLNEIEGVPDLLHERYGSWAAMARSHASVTHRLSGRIASQFGHEKPRSNRKRGQVSGGMPPVICSV
jgi:hypothetical protein